MAILTNNPALASVGNAFISLFFPNQCLVCKGGDFHSSDPICPDCLQQMDPLPIENRVIELTVNNGIDMALAGWDFGDELRTAIHSLKYEERARIGSFPKDVTDKKIGIVDDVLTTGSTISSMASVLKDAGAKTIVALTVATPLEKTDDTHTESV